MSTIDIDRVKAAVERIEKRKDHAKFGGHDMTRAREVAAKLVVEEPKRPARVVPMPVDVGNRKVVKSLRRGCCGFQHPNFIH